MLFRRKTAVDVGLIGYEAYDSRGWFVTRGELRFVAMVAMHKGGYVRSMTDGSIIYDHRLGAWG